MPLPIILSAATVLLVTFANVASSENAKKTTGALISKAPENATVYFIEPNNGSTVSKSFRVKFGLSGMGVAPAGVEKDKTGHHHILIDLETLPDMSKPLPASDHVKHFGGGQTETELTLNPGDHTLQLLLGNHLHIPHSNPVMSEKITITVK